MRSRRPSRMCPPGRSLSFSERPKVAGRNQAKGDPAVRMDVSKIKAEVASLSMELEQAL